MHQSLFLYTLLSLTILASIWGCTFHQQYRTKVVTPPAYQANDPDKADIVRGQNGYLLGFVEFDDQGTFWNRKQAVGPTSPESPKPLLDRLEAGVEPDRAMHIVIFVHGWKHNASVESSNVQTFQDILRTLQDVENSTKHTTASQVVGVYVGWRGLSIKGKFLKELSFWDRKNTAEKIGHGALTDFFRQVEALHDRRRKGNFRDDRMIIMGHSFGGAAVFSAISQILIDRFVEATAPDPPLPQRTFGDLVVLINPAFEAQRYDTLFNLDRSQARRPGVYNGSLPVLAILTSEADWATKIAFPFGRWLNTFFEKHRCEEDQKRKNRRTVGHYTPFQTHRLIPVVDKGSPSPEGTPSVQQLTLDQAAAIQQQVQRNVQRWTSRTDETPCEEWKYQFGQTRLERKCSNDAVHVNSPYLVIDVDGEIINGHNDFANPHLIEFLREFVLFATYEGHYPPSPK